MSSRSFYQNIVASGILIVAACFFSSMSAFAEEPAHETVGHHDAEVSHESEIHQDGHAATGHDAHVEHGEHGEHASSHGDHPPEIPDLLFILGVKEWIRVPAYSILTAVFIGLLFRWLARNLQQVPGRGQSLLETYVEIVDNFVCSILGKEIGRKFVPFIGTIWIYIWCMNLFCLIPFGFSATSVLQQTFGLSITVFVVVQLTAFRYQGAGGYLYHLAGEPRDAIGWCLVPLFLPLHIMGEFIKPVSLALRLRGNILGEDILLGVFSGLGILLIQALGWQDPWFGFPLHLPLIALVLLGSTIQATVFTVLTTIYISLVLPHHEEHEEHALAAAH
jgi:F-type H+-transporting ATPase subunit a